jgi:hypothetical protein
MLVFRLIHRNKKQGEKHEDGKRKTKKKRERKIKTSSIEEMR